MVVITLKKIGIIAFIFLMIVQPNIFAFDGSVSEPIDAPSPVLLAGFPAHIATIEDRYLDKKGKRSFYLIEDPLVNSSREKNIAKAVRVLAKREKIQTVFVEGGTGESSLSFLKKKATRAKRIKTGQNYMGRGLLSGPEYASMFTEHDLSLWGIEDQKLYDKSATAFETLEKYSPVMRRTVQKLENAIAELKKVLYHKGLYRLDEIHRNYEAGETPAAVYLDALAEAAMNYEISYDKYPAILSLISVKRLERKIDWKKADQERKAAFQNLTSADRKELAPFTQMNKAPEKIDFSKKENPWLFFYLLGKKITNWEQYPQLHQYAIYLDDYLHLDLAQALDESLIFRPILMNSMMHTDDERELWKVSEYVRVFKQFMNLRLSSDEVTLWHKDLKQMNFRPVTDFLKNKIRQFRITYIQVPVVPKTTVEEITRTSAAIYSLSKSREKQFVRNAVKKMTETKEEKAAFVYSGFHSNEIKKELKRRNISYLVLRPLPDKKFEQDEVKVTRERPLRSQLGIDLAHGRQPALLAFNRDIGLNGQKNLEVLLSMIDSAAPTLKESGVSEFAEEKPEVNEQIANIPEDWLYSAAVDKGYENSEDKMSYAHVITLLQEIDRKRDIERYNAFKNFAETKRSEMGKVIPVEEVLRKYEKSVVFALARAKLNSLYVSERIQKNFEAGNIQGQLPVLGWTAIGPAQTQVFEWLAGAFKNEKVEGKTEDYRLDAAEQEAVTKFLVKNVTSTGMPLSFQVPQHFWEIYTSDMDDIDSALERILLKYSLSIYDAAVWQAALAQMDNPKGWSLADLHTSRLIEGKSGELKDIRAYQTPFTYGDKHLTMQKDNAYFFRIIADQYLQDDPRFGENEVKNFPNFDRLHHEDWKPITGEQAWAAIIGPLQMAYVRYKGNIPVNCREMKLAIDILPAVEAMRSPIGAIYHSPTGTHGKDPHDISNENNFSMHAALVMLYEITKDKDPMTAARVNYLILGIENYFRKYAFDSREGVFYQGGFYENERFVPTKIYAVDCQTWGTAVLGTKFIDDAYGEGTTMRIWRNVKKRAGFYDRDRILRGVGYTDDHDVLSTEWTAGAILNARLVADAYEKTHPYWSRELRKDAITMRIGIEALKVKLDDGSIAYLYSNRRFFIPFGWWANPVPSLMSSAWVLMIDKDYNPFVLGGKMRQPITRSITAVQGKQNLGDLSFIQKPGGNLFMPLAHAEVVTMPMTPSKSSFTKVMEITADVESAPAFNFSLNRLLKNGVEEVNMPGSKSNGRYAWIWVLLLLAVIVSAGVYYRRSVSKKP